MRTAGPLLLILLLPVVAEAASPGESAFNKCKICHAVTAGAHSAVGPNLHGLYGRTAGTAPGFAYSPAMKQSGVVWDDDTLAKFLRDPMGFMPGSRMGFPGLHDDAELTALLAYLKEATKEIFHFDDIEVIPNFICQTDYARHAVADLRA